MFSEHKRFLWGGQLSLLLWPAPLFWVQISNCSDASWHLTASLWALQRKALSPAAEEVRPGRGGVSAPALPAAGRAGLVREGGHCGPVRGHSQCTGGAACREPRSAPARHLLGGFRAREWAVPSGWMWRRPWELANCVFFFLVDRVSQLHPSAPAAWHRCPVRVRDQCLPAGL